MANLVSVATGNWGTASTWGLVDATSYANAELGPEILTTAYSGTRSQAFTPGAITISAIAVKLAVRTGTTGTMSVELAIAGVGVAGTEVTINTADLQGATTAALDGGWIVLKLATPVLLVAATAYTIEAKTSTAAMISLFRATATADDLSRMLITTTTQAPVAGDDVVVAGNYTGAGTSNTLTVTMNNTATTDFGSAPTAANSVIQCGVAAAAKGVLTFLDTSAGNPYLKVSNSVIVYNGGTLNIGTTGTPIPRNSTAVLEFDLAADGDYGLLFRNGSIGNIQGLSRTSGKNVVACKVNADYTSGLILSAATAFSSGANLTTGFNGSVDGTGISRLAQTLTDNAVNGVHSVSAANTGTLTNTSQVFTVWVARGSGTNNRYARVSLANVGGAAITNGFYADVDLQAGTIGTCTAVGTGTATSSAITALGTGYICTIIGKVASGSSASVPAVWCCNASGVTSYTGDSTQCLIIAGPQVFTASSLQSAAITVDTDTGWLTGDMVAVASTTRTTADSESGTLSTDATATVVTLKQTPFALHSGTTPTQAEMILLTRNVKIRSTSSLLMTYVFCDSTSTVDIDWAELYYIGGVSQTTKRGLEVSTSTGSFSMQYSSVHDTEINGVDFTSATLNNITYSFNMMWNMSTVTGPACQIATATTGTAITIDSNILIRTGNSNGWNLADVGGTFTNNTVVGATAVGLNLAEANTIGTFSGNTFHSNATSGFQLGTAGLNGLISTLICWRNSGPGINFGASPGDVIFDTMTLFGNTTNNIGAGTAWSGYVWLKSPTMNGDTSFATTNGINISFGGSGGVLIIDNGDFSTVSGIKTAHTNDIILGAAFQGLRATLRNTKLGAATEVSTPGNLLDSGYISSQKHDQTAGLHKTWTRYGATTGGLIIDSVIFNTAAPSLRCIPTNATSKLESAPQFQGVKAAVANTTAVTPSVYVRKSVVGDAGGVAYAGSQPRLIQKANPALGQDSDVVLDTMTVANSSGTWEQLTGVSSTATDDGYFEFIVDCDGASGAWVNVDDWTVTGAGTAGAQKFWFNGLPGEDFPGSAGASTGISRARAFSGFA